MATNATGRPPAGASWLLILFVLQACALALGFALISRHLRRSRAAEAAARDSESTARAAEAAARQSESAARDAEAAAKYAELSSLRAQQDIRLSEERFRSAFDHAPIGMALLDPQGRWLRVNRALSDLTAVLSSSGIRDLTVSVNALGRIEAFLDYSDDLGDISLTYTARNPAAL